MSKWEDSALKYLAIGALCIMGADFAHGDSLKITGAAGYASEWALEGEATQTENNTTVRWPRDFYSLRSMHR